MAEMCNEADFSIRAIFCYFVTDWLDKKNFSDIIGIVKVPGQICLKIFFITRQISDMKKADQKENSRNLRISQFLIKMSVIILAAGIVVFLWGSNVLFQKACIRRETPWPDLGKADEVEYEELIDAYNIKREINESIIISAEDGMKLAGNYYERKKEAPVVLFFHGLWSHSAVDGVAIYRITKEMNWNLLLVTSRAHDESGGTIATLGIRERYDCRDWAEWAADRFGENTPLFLMGISMSGAAVMMSSNLDLPDSVCGIIEDCGYISPMEMITLNAVEKLPRWFPEGIFKIFMEAGTRIYGHFSLYEADAGKALSETNVPILIIHGDKDCTAPVSMAYSLYHRCRSEKKLFIVHGADHAESYRTDPEKYKRTVSKFLKKYAAVYIQKKNMQNGIY